jgi:hypothetical protein
MFMALSRQWKIAGAAAALAGLGIGGIAGASQNDDGVRPADGLDLRDRAPLTSVPAPDPIDGTLASADLPSPSGESWDSPLQSADDSPEGADSVDTPGETPTDMSVDSPVPAPAPPPPPAAPAPAPPPPPPPAPAPAGSVDSPASASVDSWSADSADDS